MLASICVASLLNAICMLHSAWPVASNELLSSDATNEHSTATTVTPSLIIGEDTADPSDGDQWNYEPRLWTYDDPKLLVDELRLIEEFGGGEEEFVEVGGQARSFEEGGHDGGLQADEPPPRDPHEQHNFVGSARAHHLAAASKRQSKREECNQFWVDVREAVICDKKRCEKLDFEWPKFDNQIKLIQTTRDGMRFKQIDLAMVKKPTRASLAVGRDESKSAKFDILDFLKPKPAPSPTTTTATTTTTTTTTTATTATTPSSAGGDSDKDQSQDEHELIEKSKLITTLRLDSRRLKQEMIGFGGALSDATCRNIKSLSPEMADSLVEDYFGSRGLRYNIARLSIGSSDFSTTPYTNNDRPGDVSPETIRKLMNRQHFWRLANNDTVSPHSDDDLEQKNFKLVSEDHEFKLPVVRQALATSSERELKLFASMWSPPIWMKNNSHIVHGYLKGHVFGPYYRSLSELMLKWLEAYRAQGVEFWAFTGLNEPVTGIQPFIFHNSLGITKRDYFVFLKLYLGPMLKQRQFDKLKLLLLDDNKGFAPNYVKSALADPGLEKLISGIAYHWYMNDEFENLDFIARDFPAKFLISSEASNGYLPFQVHTLPGDWDRGVAYMIDILSGIAHSSAAWVDWNMALDLGGGPSWARNNLDAPVIVNKDRDEYYKSPTFYALGHLSRFVEPGSRRLEQILAHARFELPLDAVAFLTPQNYTVVVALNANRASIPVKIVMNKRLIRQIALRPQSFSTIVFKAPKW